MPELIAGLDKKQLMIYGGIGALGVGIVVYLRYKASQEAPAYQGQPQDFGGGGGGGGYSTPVSSPVQVAAPTQSAADDYQKGLQQAEIDAANLQNKYMQERLRQSGAAFDLQQQLQQQEAAIMQPAERAYAGYISSGYVAQAGAERAQYGAQENYYKQIATKQVSCPGKDSVRIDPTTGEAYCRQKTSGGILGIPVGDIFRTVQGFVGGVEKAAPEVGYGAGKAAGSYYTQKLFPSFSVGQGRQQQQRQQQRPQRQQGQIPEQIGYGQLPVLGDYGGQF